MKRPANPYRKQLQLIGQIKAAEPQHLFGLERWFALGLAGFLMLMPGMLIRWLGGLGGYLGRKRTVDAYALTKPLALLILLTSGLAVRPWSAVVAVIMLADLYSYVLGLVFLRRFYSTPASYERSVLLLGVNFGEAILAFSVLYLWSQSIGHAGVPVSSWVEGVYFSVVTAATVGYGDLTPMTALGRLLVVLQVLTSLLFVLVVVGTFVGRMSESKRGAAYQGHEAVETRVS